jgi:hypothetical protein
MQPYADNASHIQLEIATRRHVRLMWLSGLYYLIYGAINFDLKRLLVTTSQAAALLTLPGLLLLILGLATCFMARRWAALGGALLASAIGVDRLLLNLTLPPNAIAANKAIVVGFMGGAIGLLIYHVRTAQRPVPAGLTAEVARAQGLTQHPLATLNPGTALEQVMMPQLLPGSPQLGLIEFTTVTRMTQTHWRGQLLLDRVVLTATSGKERLDLPPSDFAIELLEPPTLKRFKVRIRMRERQLDGFTMDESFSSYMHWRGLLDQTQVPYIGNGSIEFSTVTPHTQTHWQGQLRQEQVLLIARPGGERLSVLPTEFAMGPVEAPTPKRFKVWVRIRERQLQGFTTGQSYSNYVQWRAQLGLHEETGLWVPYI